jgi:hypothetical protein
LVNQTPLLFSISLQLTIERLRLPLGNRATASSLIDAIEPGEQLIAGNTSTDWDAQIQNLAWSAAVEPPSIARGQQHSRTEYLNIDRG